ncbi:MAG: hypothetical protein ACAH95_13350 [Fimbriimonas sp.]
MARIKAALLKPAPRWAHRLASLVLFAPVAVFWTCALLVCLALLFFGIGGMSSRFGPGILVLWCLAEAALAWLWAIDSWREEREG